MYKTILIDAAHKEETRVAVLENGILQDFDREALAIKQIKGNIYLARVTRVEPSLQAAFVEYGSDRHGFLPFSDIHPDYYQLSEAEKQKIKDLTRENLAKAKEEETEENIPTSYSSSSAANNDEPQVEMTSGSFAVEDETDLGASNAVNFYKRYNIQDVIKPGQVILVQVLKEERGNKGASMTTYISLAGKYCVLMANTANKGGVSKKVDNFRDRKILRAILDEINVPAEKSVIIRTAGVGKKPEDIKRDYDYLARVWNSIREAALSSSAPTFIHAEDDVIKKCIRDVYNDTVNEVVVEGKEAFDAVISFVKLTMPDRVANVKLHDERVPIFNKYKVEQQISLLYEKQISLPSGGSIVIDHTEALVAIDVNSGRANRESGVEETAYSTNMEAVREVARQLKLRDLAGLVVIDFIDMYDQKHRRNVERALRDALHNDRARIQLGRISIFGLMEMSRQRLGASFFETITDPCEHCNGTGHVRSVEIVAVSILRAIRHACADRQAGAIHVHTSSKVMSYILNYKRSEINATEKNYNIHIFLHNDENAGINGFSIKKKKGLSDEEKRELEMEVSTGKVNKLGIERNLLDDFADEAETEEVRRDNQPHTDHNRQGGRRNRRDRHRNRDRGNFQGKHNKNKFDDKKKNNSLFGGLFGLFKGK
ncbi:MAG: Ribonuclease [Rickettsiaceae bacterium]|jgi:ribonuclease E|nr:Ribonuclease [Rickettsiaceae bacterium]